MTMKSAVIKRFDLWALFKMAFVLYATLGFIAGLFYGMIIAVVGSLGQYWGEDIPGLGALSGALGVIAVPLLAMIYGVLGSIVVTVAGALYNLAARWAGGLKVGIDVADDPSTPQ